MTSAILVNFRKYTPFGGSYYEPMLDFFLSQMKKYEDEYDMIYLLDSLWEIDPKKIEGMKATIIKVDPSLTYSDAYKKVLPRIPEDLVLLMDNDTVVYREGTIQFVFNLLDSSNDIASPLPLFDVVSAIDTIGTMKVPLKLGNKFCLEFFATKKDLLMKYLEIDWSPDAMPYTETIGLLTEAMLKDDCNVYEIQADHSNILFDGTKDGEKGKDLGFYHIRAGSETAYLLASKNDTPEHKNTYEGYLQNQPKSEILRHMAWFYYMAYDAPTVVFDGILELLEDLGINYDVDWINYQTEFEKYHGLK